MHTIKTMLLALPLLFIMCANAMATDGANARPDDYADGTASLTYGDPLTLNIQTVQGMVRTLNSINFDGETREAGIPLGTVESHAFQCWIVAKVFHEHGYSYDKTLREFFKRQKAGDSNYNYFAHKSGLFSIIEPGIIGVNHPKVRERMKSLDIITPVTISEATKRGS